MAAQEYYQSSSQQYQAFNSSQPLSVAPSSQNNSVNHGQPAPSVAPSYHTNDPYSHGVSPPPVNDDPYTDPYSDNDPRKNQTKIHTAQNEWPTTQHTTYPPSPESQIPNPALMPTSRKKRRKKGGFFSGKIPWFVYFITMVQVTVFIVEIIKNSIITGSPIMIHPSFNPMIGPSTYVLINMGARFVPCMRTTYFEGTKDPYPETPWPCPNTTSNLASDASNQCTLGELCGMGSFDYNHPNQWWRFITPIFLHAGIIHIGFNMLLQMTLGRDMEKTIGTLRFVIVYLSSGIFGFVLGGNFAAPAIASTGASGALFGILALVLIDLLYTWNDRQSPGKDLVWLLFDIVISFVLGLLPGLDNFSHIGGFLMGLVLGICILHSPNSLRRRIGESRHKPSYSQLGSETNIPMVSGALKDPDNPSAPAATTTTARPADFSKFVKQPVGFFKNRQPAWWAWWLIRAGCLIGVLIGFIVLLTNFYQYRDECHWCKYLSCLDITVSGQNWCELGYMTFPKSNGSSSASGNSKRALEMVFAQAFMS